MPTSDRSIRWIENLAMQERSIQSGQKSSIDLCQAKDDILTAETRAFVQDTCRHLEYLIALFNERIGMEPGQAQVCRIGNQSDFFAVSRNGMRLVLSAPRSGAIQIQCEKISLDDPRRLRASVMFSGLVEARFGAFHEIEWYFLGSKVGPEQIARHYITEFLQASRTNSNV
ncbi:MAG: hypothetical protein HY537_10175 [Deltaproteobacteria bacterium]|nr:hypothetical protein [Deltaproteobacteria bacterium]